MYVWEDGRWVDNGWINGRINAFVFALLHSSASLLVTWLLAQVLLPGLHKCCFR